MSDTRQSNKEYSINWREVRSLVTSLWDNLTITVMLPHGSCSFLNIGRRLFLSIIPTLLVFFLLFENAYNHNAASGKYVIYVTSSHLSRNFCSAFVTDCVMSLLFYVWHNQLFRLVQILVGRLTSKSFKFTCVPMSIITTRPWNNYRQEMKVNFQ